MAALDLTPEQAARVEAAIAALRAPPPVPLPNPLADVPPPHPEYGRDPCPECCERREFCSWQCAARVTEEPVDDFPLFLRVQRRLAEIRLRTSPLPHRLVEVLEEDVDGQPPGSVLRLAAVRAHYLALMGVVRVVYAVE